MNAGKILFLIGFGICVILLFFPFTQVTGNHERIDYYAWGKHVYKPENTWVVYMDPKNHEENSFIVISFILLFAGMIMGVVTIYYYMIKPEIAPSFSWLCIIPIIASTLFFRIGMEDAGVDKNIHYFSSFYLFIFGWILMIFSYIFSIEKSNEKIKAKEENERINLHPSIILIVIGAILLAWGLAAVLLAYSRVSSPLFNFASSNVQWWIVFSFISAIVYAIVGIIALVKGFIDYSLQKETNLTEQHYTNMSIVFLILTWFIFPMAFGLMATFFGYMIYSKWNKSKGMAIIIIGIISTVISTILGIIGMNALVNG